ncbi:19558_t:CDS:2, partial [Dentiscutata erythropus]
MHLESPDKRDDGTFAWGYLGSNGPAYWYQANETYLKLEDFVNSTKIELDVAKETKLILLNTGHNYQVQSLKGTIAAPALNYNATLKVDGETYYLLQFHFHTPSEHRIEGRDLLMEGHWVFQTSSDKDAKVAVLGVFFDLGKNDEPNLKPIVDIINDKPLEVGEHVNISMSAGKQIFKKVKTVFSYIGSFTTPSWFVSRDVLSISLSQFESF